MTIERMARANGQRFVTNQPAHVDGLCFDEELTVQQAADLTGLSEHTLRYYERAGLLRRIRRQDTSGHRRYSAADIARIETLSCLRAVGMSLAGMRKYSELTTQGEAAAPQHRALLEEHQRVLEERLRQMKRNLEYVEQKIAYWRAVESGDRRRANDIATRLKARIKARGSAAALDLAT